jgi:hypothetical protein
MAPQAQFHSTPSRPASGELGPFGAAEDDDTSSRWDSWILRDDTTGFSIQGQRYASDGTPQGTQFQVNSYATGGQFRPSVAADQDGDFVVVWDSNGSPGTDHSSYSVQGQRFASSGTPQGAQFQVNAYTTGYQEVTSVAADADRDFVVVWDGVGSFGGDTSGESVQGRRYASNGSSPGGQFQINTFTTGFQRAPAVGAAADGDFVGGPARVRGLTASGHVGQRFGLEPRSIRRCRATSCARRSAAVQGAPALRRSVR